MTGATLGPLQQRAEDLVRELRTLKGRATRGNVVAAIQAAVADALQAIRGELCPLCKEGGRGHALDRQAEDGDDPEPCAAQDLDDAWARARPRLWGNLS